VGIVSDAVKQDHGLSVFIPPLKIMQPKVVYIDEFICGLTARHRNLFRNVSINRKLGVLVYPTFTFCTTLLDRVYFFYIANLAISY
jgi:hypothetical protein